MKKFLFFILFILFLPVSGVFAVDYISEYPPAHNDTYVKATSAFDGNYKPYWATDPAKSLTGTWVSNSWVSSATSQRFHIDLGTAKTITHIYYENSHNSGANTNTGSKNFTFWGSNTAGDFADLVYANNGTWVQLTTATTAFDIHVGTDTADPKYITVTNSTAYRYYAFKLADTQGSTILGFRRIVLQSGAEPTPTPTTSPTPTPTPTPYPSNSQITIPIKIWSGYCHNLVCDDEVFYEDICEFGWENPSGGGTNVKKCYIQPDLSILQGRASSIQKMEVSFTSEKNDELVTLTLADDSFLDEYEGTMFAPVQWQWPSPTYVINDDGTLTAGVNPNRIWINRDYFSYWINGSLYGDGNVILTINGSYYIGQMNSATSIPLITVYYTGLPVNYIPTNPQVVPPPECDENDLLCRIAKWVGGFFTENIPAMVNNIIKTILSIVPTGTPYENFIDQKELTVDVMNTRSPITYINTIKDINWASVLTVEADVSTIPILSIPIVTYNFETHIATVTSSISYNFNTSNPLNNQINYYRENFYTFLRILIGLIFIGWFSFSFSQQIRNIIFGR